MTQFGEQLRSGTTAAFARRIRTDKRLRQIANRVRDGTSYEPAHEYSVRVGELASEALNDNTKTLAYMSEEVAGEVLPAIMEQEYSLVTEATSQIQRNMNAATGIGTQPVVPEFDQNRVDGLIGKVSSYDKMEQARWVLGEPLINFAESVVDQAVRDNAKQAAKLGLEAVIVREAERAETRQRRKGKHSKYTIPCEWCSGLAGTYKYGTEPREVYQRHESCRCIVTFQQGRSRQDVWTKATWTADDANGRKEAVNAAIEEKRRQETIKFRERQKRLSDIDLIQRELGYSARGASIFRNEYKDDIMKYGIDYVIEAARNAAEWRKNRYR